jgi:hypothetical protein
VTEKIASSSGKIYTEKVAEEAGEGEIQIVHGLRLIGVFWRIETKEKAGCRR